MYNFNRIDFLDILKLNIFELHILSKNIWDILCECIPLEYDAYRKKMYVYCRRACVSGMKVCRAETYRRNCMNGKRAKKKKGKKCSRRHWWSKPTTISLPSTVVAFHVFFMIESDWKVSTETCFQMKMLAF